MRITKELFSFFKMNPTKGYGILEHFLAMQRAKIANKLIPETHRNGRILDIGCGSYPIFLVTTKFVEKFGIDKAECTKSCVSRRFKLVNHDIEKDESLPFEDNFIDTITMLAVLEHIEYSKLTYVMSEVYRTLKPGGLCIITVPSPWSNWVLNLMSYLKLISKVELKDHKSNLNNSEVLSILKKTDFKDIKYGYFEFFMNRWFVAKK